MQKGIIGKKLGMTQLFDANGKVVPVTIIEAGPCTVVQKKTVESDGYQAVQMGYGEVSAKKVNKAAKGHFDKADVAPKRTLREFRFDDIAAVNVGDILKADVFAEGDKVDVVGTSKGKRLPGHMGAVRVTVQNLSIVKVDAENNLIAIKGAIPGPKGSVVTIHDSVKA